MADLLGPELGREELYPLNSVFYPMSEPIPHLLENSIQIAWDYLERTGQIDDEHFTGKFLVNIVDEMIRRGERRPLVLSNKAIGAFERMKEERLVTFV